MLGGDRWQTSEREDVVSAVSCSTDLAKVNSRVREGEPGMQEYPSVNKESIQSTHTHTHTRLLLPEHWERVCF